MDDSKLLCLRKRLERQARRTRQYMSDTSWLLFGSFRNDISQFSVEIGPKLNETKDHVSPNVIGSSVAAKIISSNNKLYYTAKCIFDRTYTRSALGTEHSRLRNSGGLHH